MLEAGLAQVPMGDPHYPDSNRVLVGMENLIRGQTPAPTGLSTPLPLQEGVADIQQRKRKCGAFLGMENERPQKRQKRPVAAYCGSPERQQKASAALEPSEMEVMETVELKTTEIEMEDIHEETDEDEEYVIIPDIDSEDSNTPLAVETVELKTIEIEMEDIHEETDEDEEDEIIPDIDSVDLNNPPAVVEYVEAIHELYWKTEDLSCMDPDYMSRQPNINEKVRGLLIDWLVENSLPSMLEAGLTQVPMQNVQYTDSIRALVGIENLIRGQTPAPTGPTGLSQPLQEGVADIQQRKRKCGAFLGMENERLQKRQKRPVAAYCGSTERQQKASASLEPSEMEVMETVELKTTEIEMEDIHEETDEDEEDEIIPDIDSEDSNNPLAVETVELKTIEIEMEDIHEETDEDEEDEIIPDIDSVDLNNPPAVVEYVEAIHELYWKTEDLSCMDPDYMSRQPDIDEKMRGLLIDLLVEVQFTLELLDETLFLTVNMIDHFLAIQNVARKKLPLVGVAALLLSCKHVEAAVPVVEDLMFICDRAYPRAELLQMESFIVDTLQFYILVPTPYVFMMRFLKAAQAGEELGLLSLFLVELCLTEYKMLQFRPSLLAAAAIFTAQCTRDGIQYWSECCEVQSRYTQEQLLECSRLMVELHQKAGQGKLLAVHRKFHTPKYGCVSKYEPARFLLDTV